MRAASARCCCKPTGSCRRTTCKARRPGEGAVAAQSCAAGHGKGRAESGSKPRARIRPSRITARTRASAARSRRSTRAWSTWRRRRWQPNSSRASTSGCRSATVSRRCRPRRRRGCGRVSWRGVVQAVFRSGHRLRMRALDVRLAPRCKIGNIDMHRLGRRAHTTRGIAGGMRSARARALAPSAPGSPCDACGAIAVQPWLAAGVASRPMQAGPATEDALHGSPAARNRRRTIPPCRRHEARSGGARRSGTQRADRMAPRRAADAGSVTLSRTSAPRGRIRGNACLGVQLLLRRTATSPNRLAPTSSSVAGSGTEAPTSSIALSIASEENSFTSNQP